MSTRREFITLLGGAAATLPVTARAQQSERVRRVGVLTGIVEADAEGQARFSAFRNAMDQAGWIEGRNIQYEYRSRSGGSIERVRRNVAELLAVAPDAILVTGSLNLGALQQASHTVPAVFFGLIDPVGTGFVESLARPGGNTTGFTAFEYALSAKWVEILKELEPIVTRVGVMRERGTPTGVGLWAAMQGPASSIGMELRPIEVHDAADIERGVAAMARVAGSGFVVTASGVTIQHRDLIAGLAARHRLPAVYPFRYFVTAGGLLSYGPDLNDQFRRAAGYINRILKGERPADLPVQAPTKYELVINLKTAKALGLTVPPTLLARADEVIE
jgi:putative tryptophan/tyrosine transport system substrate-binding protein